MKPNQTESASAPEPEGEGAVRSSAVLGDTEGQTLNRPTAAAEWVVMAPGRWVVMRQGIQEVMYVIDIDEERQRLYAVSGDRLVRSVEWWSQVGGVKWVRPEAFAVSPNEMSTTLPADRTEASGPDLASRIATQLKADFTIGTSSAPGDFDHASVEEVAAVIREHLK